jgi:hypothetical protein
VKSKSPKIVVIDGLGNTSTEVRPLAGAGFTYIVMKALTCVCVFNRLRGANLIDIPNKGTKLITYKSYFPTFSSFVDRLNVF